MNRDQFWQTDGRSPEIERRLPTDTRDKARADDRRAISGIVRVLRSGRSWIAHRPNTGRTRLRIIATYGGLPKAFRSILFYSLARARGWITQVMIDSSAVKAHRSAHGGEGEKIRPSAARAAAARRKSMP
jgi:transposase